MRLERRGCVLVKMPPSMQQPADSLKFKTTRSTNIFLDLEEVSNESSPAQIVDFCNEWFDAVHDSGFEPGVYVGSKNGLNAEQLFQGTAFKHYWHAASQADPPKPGAVDRGYQLNQPLSLTASQLASLHGVRFVNPRAGNAFECDLVLRTEPSSKMSMLTSPVLMRGADLYSGS